MKQNNIIRGFKDSFKISPKIFIVGIIKGVFEGINPLIMVIFSQFIINDLAARKPMDQIISRVILALLVGFIVLVISGFLEFYFRYLRSYYSNQLELIRNNKMIDMDYSYIEDPEIIALRRRVTVLGFSGGQSAMETLPYDVSMMSKHIIVILTSLALLVPIFTFKTNTTLDSSLYLLAFVVYLGFTIMVPSLYQKKMDAKRIELEEKGFEDNMFLNYCINTLMDHETGKEIRLYKQESLFKGILQRTIKAGQWVMDAWIFKLLVDSIISTVLVQIGSLFLIVFVVAKIVTGDLGVGYVLSSVSALSMLLTALPALLILIVSLRKSDVAFDAHYQYMDLPNQSQLGSLPIEKRLDNEYDLEVKDLSFSFPSSDKVILEDINLVLDQGKSYAIVGENGSGKTTFIKLLVRLYSPNKGEILLNNINIDKYNASQYYSLFNVVFQDFSLFSFSLGETVATSKTYDSNHVKEVLDYIGFKDLPLDSIITKAYDANGIGLSGGEKQKIALARAIYKEGPVYILDEPTSALDPISEFEVYEQFNEITKDKTSIFISHRLSSCRFCDEILVFDNGRIVERGAHSDLVFSNGKYQELWHAQAQYYQ